MGLSKLKDMPAEVATVEDLAVDGMARHENSILLNVPSSLADKGVLAVRLFMYFMDNDTINEFTGNKTYMSVEESYIMSGVYSDDYLEKIYTSETKQVEKFKNGTRWVDYETKYKVIDKKADQLIRAEALRYWQQNGLNAFFEEVALMKMGNIDPEQLLRVQIIQDALRDGDDQMANRRLAVDILGMKVKKETTAINLKTRGGGEIINITAEREGAGFLKTDYKIVDLDDEDFLNSEE